MQLDPLYRSYCVNGYFIELREYLVVQLRILTPGTVESLFSKVARSERPLLSLRVYMPFRLPTCQHSNKNLWSVQKKTQTFKAPVGRENTKCVGTI